MSPPPPVIVDLHSGGFGGTIKSRITEALQAGEVITPDVPQGMDSISYRRTIPTEVMYSAKGLKLYEQITKLKEYYPFAAEKEILGNYGDEIACRMFGLDSSLLVPSEDEMEKVKKERHYEPSPAANGAAKKEKWGDQSVGIHNEGVNGGLNEPRIAMAVELGSGSLDKTRHVLRSMSNLLNPPNKQSPLTKAEYRALDLERSSLVRSLEDMATQEGDAVTTVADDGTQRVYASGLFGLYDDGLALLRKEAAEAAKGPPSRDSSPDQPRGLSDFVSTKPRASDDTPTSSAGDTKRAILWLGSSIGNLTREEAVGFLGMVDLGENDTMLIGIDNCDDKEKIEMAYNDPHGVTRDFILAGIDEAGLQLHGQLGAGEGLCAEAFEYVSRYNSRLGRHEAYVKPKKANHRIPMPDSMPDVVLGEDEHIFVETSYKYTQAEVAELLAAAGLRQVQRWSDSTNVHSVYSVEKPRIALPAVAPNPCGLPSMAEWEQLWGWWDCLQREIIPAEMMHTKTVDLRHIPLFYVGHIPAFRAIHLARLFDEPITSPAHYATWFERGIDPSCDDPSVITHSHSKVPTTKDEWPTLDEIRAYELRVRERVRRAYDELDGQWTRKQARVMQMVWEHEAMHAETSVQNVLQACERLNVPGTMEVPDFASLARGWERQVEADGGRDKRREAVVVFGKTEVQLGVDDDEAEDATKPFDAAHPFVWDCEAPARTVQVDAFKVRALPISNGDYLAHLVTLGDAAKDSDFPTSWAFASDSKTLDPSQLAIKTLYGPVPFAFARDWPVAASGVQLEAVAKAAGGRLPTHEEIAVWMRANPPAGAHANVGLRNLHPVPPMLPGGKGRDGREVAGANGGLWEMTGTVLAGWEGYKPSVIYPGYSSDFHDGKHMVVVGGSYLTAERLARPSGVNFYQKNYPYVLATARIAFDA